MPSTAMNRTFTFIALLPFLDAEDHLGIVLGITLSVYLFFDAEIDAGRVF